MLQFLPCLQPCLHIDGPGQIAAMGQQGITLTQAQNGLLPLAVVRQLGTGSQGIINLAVGDIQVLAKLNAGDIVVGLACLEA